MELRTRLTKWAGFAKKAAVAWVQADHSIQQREQGMHERIREQNMTLAGRYGSHRNGQVYVPRVGGR